MFIRTPLPQHPENLKALTALRFWAALWVVLFHMLQATLNTSSLFDRVVSRGALGVDLFFILSGFILMHVYAHQFCDRKFSYRDFLRNRFARIYPLHFFMILIMVAAYTIAGQLGLIRDAEGMNWSHLPWHILALHAWGFTDGHSWNFPSWSISAEFFAYLIFPFYLFAFQQLKPFVLLAIAIVSFSLFNIYLTSIDVHISQLMFNFGISRIFFEFLLGVGLYAVTTQIRFERGVSTVCAMAMLIVVFVSCHLGFSDSIIVVTLGFIVYFVASMSYAAKDKNLYIFDCRFFTWLGEVSYSTYMVHILVVIVMQKVCEKLSFHVSNVWVIFFTLALIYAFSALSYYLIELPFRERLRGSRRH